MGGFPSFHRYGKRHSEVEDAAGSYVDSLKSLRSSRAGWNSRNFVWLSRRCGPASARFCFSPARPHFSYDEAATICENAVGTIQSRVNRARTRLSKLLSIDSADRFGQDHTTRAVLTVGSRGCVLGTTDVREG